MYRLLVWWPRYRLLALFAALILLLSLLLRSGQRLTTVPSCDFLQFWAAARLNLLGKNPFEPDHIQVLWQAEGRYEPRALVTYNPPWLLTLMAPWAVIDARTSWILWQGFLWGCILVSTDYLWRSYGGSTVSRWMGWVIGILFVPGIIAVRSGQLGPVMLLGLVLFLVSIDLDQNRAQAEWLAGIGVLLVALKPHILFLFWVALVLWCVGRRRWSLIGKANVLIGALLLFAVLANPPVLRQYIEAFTKDPPDQWISTTWGSFLRLALGWEHFWLQFVPSVLTAMGYTVYVWCRVRRWDWKHELPGLVLLALITRPYGWTHDVSLAVFPLIAVTAKSVEAGMPLKRTLVAYAVLQVAMVVGNNRTPQGGDHRLVWFPLAVTGFCMLMATWTRRHQV